MRTLLFSLIFAGALSAQFGGSPIRAVAVAPSGACTANLAQLVGPGGQIYTCQAGTWAVSTGGAPGPTGPTGPQGSAGATGATGPAGTNGNLPGVTRTDSTHLAIGANCTAAAPCNFSTGTTNRQDVATIGTVTISANTGTMFIYFDSARNINAISTAITATCGAGCTVQSNGALPNGAIVLYSWHATSGTWDATGTDQRGTYVSALTCAAYATCTSSATGTTIAGSKIGTDPTLFSWNYIGQSGGAVTTPATGGVLLTTGANASGGNNWYSADTTVGIATPYTATVEIYGTAFADIFSQFGMFVKDGTTNAEASVSVANQNALGSTATGSGFNTDWSNNGTFSNDANARGYTVSQNHFFARMTNDGTTITKYISIDGNSWQLIGSTTSSTVSANPLNHFGVYYNPTRSDTGATYQGATVFCASAAVIAGVHAPPAVP